MRKFYLLTLFLLNGWFAYSQSAGCSNPISTFPYSEHFANGPGGWTSGGNSSSWGLGYPAGKMEIYYPASDSNCWVTSLTDVYNPDENSYVMSPCFNFSGLVAPAIELKIWWNSEFNADGAVLQSSIDGGLTWQNVGTYNDPYNWYNGNAVGAGPGGQILNAVGWTGRVGSLPGNGSQGWVTAKHKLTGLAGQPSVRLRIAFAADSQYEDDGFGFDDVQIYETPTHDAGVLSIVSPVSKCGNSGQESVTIMVKNYGRLVQNSIPVSYRLSNNPPVTETITSPVAPDDTLFYTFNTKLNVSANQDYTLIAYSTLPSDAVTANDTVQLKFTSVPTIATYPYFQNFENGNGGWLASGQNSSWALGTPSKFIINAAASGTNSWVTNLNGNYNSEENSWVLGPCFNLSSLVNPLITMKVWWNSEDGNDGAVLQSSVDGGTTWQNVGAFGDPDNWYNSNTLNSPVGGQVAPAQGWSGSSQNFPSTGSNGWVTVKHLLTGLGGQSNVKLRIAFASDIFMLTDEGFAFDDVAIYENPAHDIGITKILAPVSGTCGAGSQENITVTIKNYGHATQTSIPLTYQIGSNAVVTGTFTGSLASGATANFTFPTKADLSAGGTFYLKTTTVLPADTFLTNNAVVDTISIFNPIAVYPHAEDIETATTGDPGILPAGWKLKTGTAIFYPYSWKVAQGPASFPGTGPETDHTTGTALGKYLIAPASSSGSLPGDSTELETPCFNLSSLTSPGFSFWYHLAGADINKFKVQISTDNGATWATIFTLTGPQQPSKAAAWRKKVINLQGYSGNVKLKFKAYQGNGPAGDIALDDLKFFNLAPTDIEMYTLQLPAPGCDLTSAETICVSLINSGTATQTNFPVTYRVNSGTPVTEMFTGSIPSGGNALFCFNTKANLSNAGQNTVLVSANPTGDADLTNNELTDSTYKFPVVSTFPYQQHFENGSLDWTSGGTNNSWALGTPNKTVINAAASGTKAWVTNLNGNYNANENSYVLGPCFNFSALAGDPDFEMKAWWNAHTGNDGAVLQTSVDGGLTWQNVGRAGEPHNWFNDSAIYAQPGGQQFFMAHGWTGTTSDKGSKGWVTVKHKLTGMAGLPKVQLRIAFAADSWNEDDGFAFDDIKITDNTNNLAVTNFTPLTANCGYSTNETVQVTLENLGTTPVSNVNMQFKVNNGALTSATFAGPLAGGAKTNFTFPTGANLAAAGNHTITVIANATNDPEKNNDTLVYALNNPLYNSLPLAFDFETSTTGLANLTLKTNRLSAITNNAGASFGTGTNGMVLDGKTDSSWIVPVGITNPWASNPENFAGAYFCFTPTGFAPTDSLWLEFDLKQLYKDAAANTNFRVTVNGTQKGITHRPPFGGGPEVWKHVKIPLTAFISQGTMQIGLESSAREAFANGAGTANLIDNVQITGNPTLGVKETAKPQLVVYPNPSSGLFNVQLPETGKTFELEVRDLSGRLVKRETVSSRTSLYQLNLQPAAKGIYLLKVASDKQVMVQKLVIE